MKRAVWPAPIAIAVASSVGLVAGLLGDGPWDWVSWLGLALPLAVCIRFGLRPARAKAPVPAGRRRLLKIRG